MTSFLDEEVPAVNPLGVAAIEEVGRCFLEQLCPGVLARPQPLDVMELVDTSLPEFGIHVYPATRQEIGDRAGATDPNGNGEVVVLVSESVWESLNAAPPISHFARTTVCHEIGHAILHVPILRRQLLLTNALARVQRARLKAYEDPEWQAWAFAGAILMPSITLKMLHSEHGPLLAQHVGAIYQVSESMAASHLRRLKWPVCVES